MQKQVGLRLDEELLGRVDAARGDVPRNRWIERALEDTVAYEEKRRLEEDRYFARQRTVRFAGQLPDENTPASPRASVPLTELERRGLENVAEATSEGIRERIGTPRACERCGTRISSPSLTRHPNCGGKVVPEPV